MNIEKIKRLSNGTIDVDFYRQETFRLRREATNKLFRRIRRASRPLIGAVTIIANYALLTPREPSTPSTNSIFVSAEIPLAPTEPKK
jgi:chromosomal replication initiation ATPase DnaA